MKPQRLVAMAVGIAGAWGLFGAAGRGPVAQAEAVYHVSPTGDDGHDGKSPATPWRTLAHVNAQRFEPGDQILFDRGGTWRESLVAGSSGRDGRPIVFGAYGSGPRPRFSGSDPLDKARFEPGAGGVFQIKITTPIHAVLVDHSFLRNARLVTKDADPGKNLDHVRDHPGSWFADGTVVQLNTGGIDPRTDPRDYSVVIRDDAVSSNGQDHLVFRDLVVEETARSDAGYAFRIMGSNDVRVERCVAYRAGKHHFGVINSTRFVGVDLIAAVAMPDQGAGGASAYVTYSDRTRRGDTSEYHHCRAEDLGDPGTGGNYPTFVTHGAGVGSILLDDLTSLGGEISVGNDESGASIRVRGGRLEDATLVVHGRKIEVDGMTIVGSRAGVVLDGAENTLQNLLMTGMNPGFAGHQAAITEGGHDNRIRFCTVVMDPRAPDFNAVLSLKQRDSRLHWSGNVMISTGTVVRVWFPGFDPQGYEASWNFYGRQPRFDTRVDGGGRLLGFEQWQTLGLDRSSVEGDPLFTRPSAGDYTPMPGSPTVDAMRIDPSEARQVLTDIRGQPRLQGGAMDIGAYETSSEPGPSMAPPR